MRTIASVDDNPTAHDIDDVLRVMATVPFPAHRDDLLLHAIASHATPAVIGTVRGLPGVTYADAAEVGRFLRS